MERGTPAPRRPFRALARARTVPRRLTRRVKPRRSCGISCWPSWKSWGSRTISTPGHSRHGQRQTPADGGKVREAFGSSQPWMRTSRQPNPASRRRDETRSRIDKSVLALPEPKRKRDKQHLRLWPNDPAWSAAANLPTRTIFAFRSRADWHKRSAMNSPSRCAGRIIANCTAPARNGIGGRETALSRSNPRGTCGR
jgi:hypothetical protein